MTAPTTGPDLAPGLDDAFHRALSMREWVRVASRNPRGQVDPDLAVRAAYVVDAWKRDFGEAPEVVRLRLDELGVDSDELLALLATPIPASPRPAELAFAPWLSAACAQAAPPTFADDGSPDWWQRALFEIVAPLLDHAADEALTSIASAELPATLLSSTHAVVRRHVPMRFVRILTPAFVQHMQVRALEGQVTGRADRFVATLEEICASQESRMRFWAAYPFLARLIAVRVIDWAESCAELTARLVRDRELLREWLGLDTFEVLEVHHGLGDEHDGGRSVARVVLEGATVAYKPRPVRLLSDLQALLADIDDGGDDRLEIFLPDHRDRGDYGWVRWVDRSPCASRDEVTTYYRRLGALAAFAWALGATDLHSENILASGSRPYLIDVETFFTPQVESIDDPAHRRHVVLRDSPAATGILPTAFTADDLDGDIDLSAFGSSPDHVSLVAVPMWQEAGTERMTLVLERLHAGTQNSVPLMADETEVDSSDHGEALLAGFSAAVAVLRRRRDHLLGPRSPLRRFEQTPVRVVLRATAAYIRLLLDGTHPDLLRDGALRERHFLSLDDLSAEAPSRAAAVSAEVEQLLRGDVPMFTALAGGHDLLSGAGRVAEGFFSASGLDVARRRIATLDEDCEQRLGWAVQATLTMRLLNRLQESPFVPFETCCHVLPTGRTTPDRLVAAATRIGTRLRALAHVIPATGEPTWLDLRTHAGLDWRIVQLDDSMYGGLTGQLIAFEHLAVQTRDPAFASVADRLRAAWELRIATGDGTVAGGFEGLGGELYTALVLWRHQPSDRLARLIATLVQRLGDDAAGGPVLDVLRGSAGAIMVLLHNLHVLPDRDLRRQAVAAARWHAASIRARARRTPHGVTWETRLHPDGLVGAAHGSSGIGYALRLVAAHDPGNREDLLELARGAWRWEQSMFVPERGNWRDLRQDPDHPRADVNLCTTSWCNGGTGIGFMRALGLRRDLYASGERSRAQADVDAAIASSLADGLGHGQTICHGDMGVAEFLLAAGRPREARRVAGMVAEAVGDEGRTVSGVLHADELPALMTGGAGVATSLLRMARPDAVGSVLALEA